MLQLLMKTFGAEFGDATVAFFQLFWPFFPNLGGKRKVAILDAPTLPTNALPLSIVEIKIYSSVSPKRTMF